MTGPRWLVPLLLLAGLVLLARWPGAADLWARVVEAGPGVVLLAIAGLLGSHGLRGLRLHAEWQPRAGVSRLECLRVALLHSAAVNLMPMRSGELGFPWLLWRRWQVPVVDSASCLLWMRAQDALVLLWLGVLSAAAVVAGAAPAAAATPVVLAGLATLGFLAVVSWAGRAHRPASNPRPLGAPRLHALLIAVRRALAGATPATWAWTLCNWLLKLATLGGLMSVLIDQRALVGWCAALAGEGAAALPVQAPAGFGTYEAAAALGARLAGQAPLEHTLAAALTVHLFTLAVSLLGALWASLGRGPRPLPAQGSPEGA